MNFSRDQNSETANCDNVCTQPEIFGQIKRIALYASL